MPLGKKIQPSPSQPGVPVTRKSKGAALPSRPGGMSGAAPLVGLRVTFEEPLLVVDLEVLACGGDHGSPPRLSSPGSRVALLACQSVVGDNGSGW